MKDKHTPGPWHVKRGNGIYKGNSYLSLVLTENQHDGDLPYEANARLMAAAPELLEAIKESMWYIDLEDSGANEWYLKTEELIAKIEGD